MTGEIVEFSLPEGATIKGCLFASHNPELLAEDLVEVDLPSGLTIDLGWYPEGEPSGSFQIVLYSEYWGNQIIPPIQKRTIPEVVQTVEELARLYSQSSSEAYVTSCANTQSELMAEADDSTFKIFSVAA
jgi:hypothetical protein